MVVACGPALLSGPEAGLFVRAYSSTPTYSDPADFHLAVTLDNGGDSAVVILPGAIRRSYTPRSGGAARYMPFPGPRLAPWKGAFLLLPGQAHTLEFTGMRDGDGIWDLERGRYELTVRFHVTPNLARSAEAHTEDLGAPAWVGDITSDPIAVSFVAQPAAQQGAAAERPVRWAATNQAHGRAVPDRHQLHQPAGDLRTRNTNGRLSK